MGMAVEDFVAHLSSSGLMPSEEVDAFRDSLPDEKKQGDAQEFARELVRQKKLTAYQATAVYQGKALSLFLGKYLVLDKLGQGGMGMVFKARHRTMQRLVAVKVLPSSATKSPENVQRFHREVQAAARLTHPNIVAAFDAGEANKTHFLVMEFVDGRDLSQLVKKQGPLPVEKAVECILQAAQGLAAAHQAGIVHRDIKPANLLLDQEGVVKILDMGLARLDDGASSGMTQTGTIMGTVDYMSPEQAMNTKNADGRSDIYSLGCSLYFLIAGKVPFQGDSLMEKLMAHREQPIPSLTAECPAAPPALDAVFQKMMAKEQTHRYQTMGEVIQALQTCLTASPVAANFGLEDLAVAPEENSALLSFLRNNSDIQQPASSPSVKSSAGDSKKTKAGGSSTLKRPASAETIAHSNMTEPKAVASVIAQKRVPRNKLIAGVSVVVVLLVGLGFWMTRTAPPALVDNAETKAAVKANATASTATKTVAAAAKSEPPPLPLFLDDLIATDVFCYPKNVLATHGKDHTGATMLWKETPLEHSLFMHPAGKEKLARVVYRLDKGYSVMRGTAGMVRRSVSPQVFHVYGDGKLIWESLPMQSKDSGKEATIDLRGIAELRLEVVSDGDTGSAHAVWIDAQLTPVRSASSAPTATPVAAQNSPSPVDVLTSPDWVWTEPVEVGAPFAGEPGESGASVTPDGLLSVITSRSLSATPHLGKEAFLLTRLSRTAPWSAPVNAGANVNQPGGAYTPRISPDGLELYFRSSRPGGQGGNDLWVATRLTRAQAFGKPVNMGSSFNSPYEESTPAISPDGLTFAFQSERESQPRILKLWISTRKTTREPFATAKPLDAQVQVPGRTSDPVFTADGLGLMLLANPDPQKRRYRLATRPNLQSPFNAVVSVETPWDDNKQMLPNCLLPDGRTLWMSWARGTQIMRTVWSVSRVRKTELSVPPAELLTSSNWEWTKPENLGPNVNSPGVDQSPTLSRDGLILMFASDREDKGKFDIWECRRKSITEPFGPAVKVAAPVNSLSTEIDPFLRPDGLTLLFASTNPSGSSGPSRGALELKMLTRTNVNATWGQMKFLGSPVNSAKNEHAPSLSEDGLTLLFQSDRDGGVGNHDLWVARRKSVSDAFGEPENLGKLINTTGREEAPFLLADGHSFLYSHVSSGQRYQIFLADLSNLSNDPKPVILPDGSASRSPALWSDGRTLFFSSWRANGLGELDLYVTRLVPVNHSGATTHSLAMIPRTANIAAAAAPVASNTTTAATKSAAPEPREPSPYEILTSPDWEWTAPENLGSPVNTSAVEDSPTISADGLVLMFHSTRSAGLGNIDLWQSTRKSIDEPFGPAVNAGPAVNSDQNDSDPYLSPDGKLLLYSSTRTGSIGSSDIWMSSRASVVDSWSPPENLGTVVNKKGSEYGPALSADELLFVLHSGRPGGLGGDDLWMSRRNSPKDPFGEAVNLGPTVNSPQIEMGGTLSADGLVLVFHRREPQPQQPSDLWMATRPNVAAAFGPAELLPAVVNSSTNEQQPALSPDGRTLYFASNRAGGKGSSDLWVTRRVKKN